MPLLIDDRTFALTAEIRFMFDQVGAKLVSAEERVTVAVSPSLPYHHSIAHRAFGAVYEELTIHATIRQLNNLRRGRRRWSIPARGSVSAAQ